MSCEPKGWSFHRDCVEEERNQLECPTHRTACKRRPCEHKIPIIESSAPIISAMLRSWDSVRSSVPCLGVGTRSDYSAPAIETAHFMISIQSIDSAERPKDEPAFRASELLCALFKPTAQGPWAASRGATHGGRIRLSERTGNQHVGQER